LEKTSAGKGKRRLILRMMAQISAHFLVRDEVMAEAFQRFLAKFQSLTSESPQYGTVFYGTAPSTGRLKERSRRNGRLPFSDIDSAYFISVWKPLRCGPGQRGQCSDLLLAARFAVRTPTKEFFFSSSHPSRVALETTQTPVQLISGFFPRRKGAGVWR